MRIVTWNVNSIRERLEKLPDWLAKWEPDALCLQETKVVDADFPHAEIEAMGYRASVYGQKTYVCVPLESRRGATGPVEPAWHPREERQSFAALTPLPRPQQCGGDDGARSPGRAGPWPSWRRSRAPGPARCP